MHRLGYTRYVAQGGDQGASITDAMGRLAPEGLLGIHMNLLVTALGGGAMPEETEQERTALEQTNPDGNDPNHQRYDGVHRQPATLARLI